MYSKALNKEKYIEAYRKWLELMNYDISSINYSPVRLDHFLEWMRGQGVEQIDQITGSKVIAFFEALSHRKNKRTGGALSVGTLRTYRTTISRFARYLRQSGEANIDIPVHFKGEERKPIVILSQAEITKLYEACEDSLLGLRDKAFLSICYGCGARKREAIDLKVNDILLDRNLLCIRKGKGNKERYVPMVGQVKNDIVEYLTTARPMLMTKQVHEAFFVGINGEVLGVASLYERVRKLLQKAKIYKKGGVHILRHSIATHLLKNGMKLSDIAQFLGHSSLESTQIYTHIEKEI